MLSLLLLLPSLLLPSLLHSRAVGGGGCWSPARTNPIKESISTETGPDYGPQKRQRQGPISFYSYLDTRRRGQCQLEGNVCLASWMGGSCEWVPWTEGWPMCCVPLYTEPTSELIFALILWTICYTQYYKPYMLQLDMIGPIIGAVHKWRNGYWPIFYSIFLCHTAASNKSDPPRIWSHKPSSPLNKIETKFPVWK